MSGGVHVSRAPIAVGSTSLVKGLRDPVTNQTIFVLDGSDPTAMITPGVNWLSGPQCNHYPTLPAGNCALGEPGLIDAILDAAALYRAWYARLAAGGLASRLTDAI